MTELCCRKFEDECAACCTACAWPIWLLMIFMPLLAPFEATPCLLTGTPDPLFKMSFAEVLLGPTPVVENTSRRPVCGPSRI